MTPPCLTPSPCGILPAGWPDGWGVKDPFHLGDSRSPKFGESRSKLEPCIGGTSVINALTSRMDSLLRMTTGRSVAFEAWREAVTEYEAAVDALNKLAESLGQGDRTVPLIVRDSDTALGAAVKRELDAKKAVDLTRDALDRSRQH